MDERHDRLRKARIAAGFATQADAVRRFSWNPNTYKSNENGNAPFSFDQAQTYAKAYKVRAEWLYSGKGAMRSDEGVPIIGKVGADPEGRIIRTLGQGSPDMAPLPTGGTSNSVALEVDGHSMHTFAEDGALVYFEDQKHPPTEDMIGEIVVVQVARDGDEANDEDVLIKRLQRGSAEGLYNLESILGPTIRDVRIRWAAEIIQITPPRQARRLLRRGLI
ncbi:peptidase S24 [Brevundimonas aurantiaca]|jgi:SOS-response transcriptional repressor LexA|uniref:peptidase S24 n=1 Tax=Brevundimonas aurantiaca TaxID=74316 RepID=UPI001D17FD4A|nr:peptidase S24 [Brevundimonas aurantiaca]MCC4295826.1 peptidase S24 [Brevundimonas aurantiaca]